MQDARNRWSHRAVYMLPAVLIGVLAFHFLATVVLLMPSNPVSIKLRGPVKQYMYPFFSQKWNLFAPDPEVDTRMLLLSCRWRTENGSAVETGYVDITSPLRDTKSRNRFTPASGLERAQLAVLYMLFPPPDPLIDRLSEFKDKQGIVDETQKQLIEKSERIRKLIFERGLDLLSRIGSAECDRLYSPKRTIATRFQVMIIESPPFSQRKRPLSEGHTRYVELDWRPYQRVSML